MTKVKVRNGESLEQALRRLIEKFKKLVFYKSLEIDNTIKSQVKRKEMPKSY